MRAARRYAHRHMGTFTERIAIDAPASSVWAALADIGRIHLWNPGVRASYITSSIQEGLGACRRCELGAGNYLDEEVVDWVPEGALTMRIAATNLPFKSADIRFTLETSGDVTIVTLSPTYVLRFGMLGRLLDATTVRSTYRRAMVALLGGLKDYVEKSERAHQR